jgi:hypothetical protein
MPRNRHQFWMLLLAASERESHRNHNGWPNDPSL